MPTNFEIAVISLLAFNILITLYYNYQSEEDYEAKKAYHSKRPQETKKK